MLLEGVLSRTSLEHGLHHPEQNMNTSCTRHSKLELMQTFTYHPLSSFDKRQLKKL